MVRIGTDDQMERAASFDKGTIEWHKIADGVPPPNRTLTNGFGCYSNKVLLTNGFNIYESQYVHFNGAIDNEKHLHSNWLGYNLMPNNITHWAYINMPKK